jgi:DNA-binding NarL/FixJ family response regulator
MKQSAIQESSSRALTIVLISNNPVLRRGLHIILKESPFVSEIAEVAVSSQAVDTVVREKPQVVVVDLRLVDADRRCSSEHCARRPPIRASWC